MKVITGGCACGGVRYEVRGPLRDVIACHCVQCRKQSGHYFASTNVPRALLAITGEENLSWYKSSTKVRRGFCSKCGSFLLWDPIELDYIAVAMGAFDTPTSTHLAKHIFVAEKGDYYQISDELPQSTGY